MRGRPVTNVPAPIHARLLNLARSRDTQLNFLLQSYAAERFLYRLGRSPVSDRFTLKGATLFVVWGGETIRGTQDVDLLRSGFPREQELRDDLAAIGMVPCPEDGVVFEGAAKGIRLRPLPVGRTQGAVRARWTRDWAGSGCRCRWMSGSETFPSRFGKDAPFRFCSISRNHRFGPTLERVTSPRSSMQWCGSAAATRA